MSQVALPLRPEVQSNPFSSSRVDTPFQKHPDLKDIYEDEFKTLKSSLVDVKRDANHQSNGVVIIGEPGSGKTHLMMRLAQEMLNTNRLLFIRQPNNAETILFHIYSRILESLVEPVSGSSYNQLQYLLSKSIVKFLQDEQKTDFRFLKRGHYQLLKKLENVLEKCGNDPLHFFEAMGSGGTENHRSNWDRLIKLIRPWWTKKYSKAAYSWSILQGIMKYCRYSDLERKDIVMRWLAGNRLDEEELKKVQLEDWSDDLSREDFSLQAISVLSKLSLLDEPLIIIFDQLEGLGPSQNRRILESFGEAVKEIFTHVPNSLIIFNLFPDRWRQMRDEVFDGSIADRIAQYIIPLERRAYLRDGGVLLFSVSDARK